MKKILSIFFGLFIACILPNAQAQLVSTYYNFSQNNGTYTPLVANNNTTPANIYTTTWDDIAYTGYTLPFAFTYNGTLYPAGTTIGLDTDGWIAFNPGTMTGQYGGGSWVSASNSTGMYLYGSANNNGFAGFNADLHNQSFATINGTLTNGNNRITDIDDGSEKTNLRIGTRLIGTGIPDGAVITNLHSGNNYIDMSMPATTTTAINGATITPAASIFAMTRGTAPNRQFVIQWTQVRRYYNPNNDNFSFQMILNEGNGNPQLQTLQVVYGNCSTNAGSGNALNMQVGLRGAANTDFNARQSSTSWAATTAATANNQHVALYNSLTPASGLTFTWSPCTSAPSNAGSISGLSPVCPGTSQTYTLSAVPGATYYTWTYTGTGVTLSATTNTPSNTLTFSNVATGGVLSVVPSNICGSGNASPNFNINVTSIIPATISYPASTYCSSQPPASVTLTGPSGGTYSASPAGLSINSATGQITPSTSSAGSYTVTYTYNSNGCTVTTQTNVSIKPVVTLTSNATPASLCLTGNVQLSANASPNGYSVQSIAHTMLSPASSATNIWTTTIDDDVSAAIPMPFTFNFYGQNITQFFVSTNGFIQLGNTTGSHSFPQSIPSATDPNNIIAMVWDDLEIDLPTLPGAYVRYFVNGTSPNRILIVEYNKLIFYGSDAAAEVSGQIRLYESDNHIEVALTKANDNGDTEDKTLGIENATGTQASFPPNRNYSDWDITAPEAWAFYPTTYNYVWSPTTNLSNPAIANPMATGLTANTTYTVQATDASTGCSATSSVTITVTNPQISSTTPGERCGPGTVNLSATGNGSSFNWYTAATGGSPIANGNTYTTPVLSSTTNYWVSSSNGANSSSEIGAGALTATHTDNVNPFRYYFGSRKSQYLITAAELSAIGLTAGPINNLGIDVVTPANTYIDLSISMKNTATTGLTTGAWETGLTQVYGPSNFNAVTGINTFALAGFSWDGSSNLLIQFCWGNNNSGGSSSTTVRYDNTSYSTFKVVYWDNRTSASICSDTYVDAVGNQRPKFIFSVNTLCEGPRTMVTATVKPLDTWIGVNSNWNDAQNWCPGIPTATTNVIIPVVGSGIYPILTSGQTAHCNNLTINAGAANININNGAVLNARGNIVNNGSITNNGTISLTGTNAVGQNFPGPGSITAMKVLEIANTGAGVHINKNFAIDSLLKSTSGSLYLNNYDITLRSTNTHTASVSRVFGTFNYGTGRFVVERYIKNVGNWNLIASPTAEAQTIYNSWQEGGANNAGYGTRITGPVVANGLDQYSIGYSMKWWDGNNAIFSMKGNTQSNATDSLVNRHTGYFLFVRGDRSVPAGSTGSATTLRSWGKLYIGNSGSGITPPAISYTALAAGDFISIANPFASAIDPTVITASGLKQEYSVWDPTEWGSYGVGNYRTFSQTGAWLTTPTPTLPSAYPAGPYKQIQSGQAFMMEANGTSASVSFEETDKIDGSLTFSRTPQDVVMMSTMLHTADGNIPDGNRVAFDAAYSDSVGIEDASKLMNGTENFGIAVGNKQIIIEGRPPLTEADTIFYRMANMRTQNYQLSFEPRNLGNTGLVAELIDQYLNSRTAVSLTDSTYYSFSITADAASKAANRFMLVFRTPGGTVPVTFVNIAAQRQTDRSIKINWEVANETNIAHYQVERSADGSGFTGILTQDATNSRHYTKNDLSPLANDNYYRIKAIGVAGDISYSNVVKVAPVKEAGSIVLLNNPVRNKRIQLRFNQMPAGQYSYTLSNNLGQRVALGNITISSNIQQVTLSAHRQWAAGFYKLTIINTEGGETGFNVMLE